MKKVKVYRDRAGNTLYLEGLKQKLAVRNAQNKLVDTSSFNKFLRMKVVKNALTKKLGKGRFVKRSK